MKKPLAQIIPLLARGLPPAAVASSLLSPAAMGASGDLDPSFGDLGRMTELIVAGPAWSLESLENDAMVLAGGNECGGWYCGYYYDYAYNFVSLISDTGSVDEAFTAARLRNVEVFDVVLQEDRKVIGVGRTVENTRARSSLTIFRLEPDGALDLTFGEDGIVRGPSGLRNTAGAVALEPDGRIVVAGSQDGRLIVLRLFPDGAPDDSFGSSGQFQGPMNQQLRRMHMVRTAAGGYRVTANSFVSCSVVALTASGELDATFGAAGIAQIGAALTRCNSMTAQKDERLLLAGEGADGGFATRLLASGATDPSFAADVVPDLMAGATAIAVGADDSIVVAGRGEPGVPGAVIVRLQANGELDALFGQAGSTWIDLPAESDPSPEIHDMTVLADRRIVAAGGAYGNRNPFAIRLLGDAGGDSPGVISITSSYQQVAEEGQQAVVTLRRSGGSTGSVSVEYQTESNEWDTATGGADYTQVAGRLTWEDGELSEQQIVVPIAFNDGAEGTEWFTVVLGSTQGGAGLGTRVARIEIVGDPPPPIPEPPPGAATRPPRSGGGALGFLSLLLLGVSRLLPSRRRASG
jgi:uncharacterized delta-60 repeat protein